MSTEEDTKRAPISEEKVQELHSTWGNHPNSLRNLRPAFTKDNAKAMQAKGAESRRMKREQAEALKTTAEMYKRLKEEMPEIDALGIMQVAVLQYLEDGNLEDASRIAMQIAPYQRARLASIDQQVTTSVTEMSDEELKKIVAQLGAQAGSAVGEGGNGPSD